MILKTITTAFNNLIKSPFYKIYQNRLTSEAKNWNLPKHIGIILDGNRRYARDKGIPDIIIGHTHGAEKLDEVLNWSFELGIPVVTIWIFSLDNFQREQDEVDGLLSLIERKTREYVTREEIHKNGIKVQYIGKIEMLPDDLKDAINEMETVSKNYDKFLLNVAIAYGGREEITDAFRSYLNDQSKMGNSLDQILSDLKPESIDSYLYTSGLPDPDLIIRTSGEERLSGFLLWQSAYSEFYFCDTYWPQFRKIDFLRAIRSYHRRKRRYGR